jgi:hypothetical protein
VEVLAPSPAHRLDYRRILAVRIVRRVGEARRRRGQQHDLGDARSAVTGQVADDFAAGQGRSNQHRAGQHEGSDHLAQVVGQAVVVVAVVQVA